MHRKALLSLYMCGECRLHAYIRSNDKPIRKIGGHGGLTPVGFGAAPQKVFKI